MLYSHVITIPFTIMPCLYAPHILASQKHTAKPNMTNLTIFKWKNKDGEVKKFRLKSRVVHKWRDIGDIVTSYEQLEVWDKDKDSNGCCSAVLNHWLNHPPSQYPATWEGLIELLDDIELSNVAIELKVALENAI